MSEYCIESIKEAGITDIAIIIGGLGSNKVKEYYGDGENFGVNITYIEQDEPRGIAHAIRLCKEFVNNEKFLVFLGDNIIQKPITDFIENFNKSDYDATVLLCEVDNPNRFGIADVDNEKIVKITEKPKNEKTEPLSLEIKNFIDAIEGKNDLVVKPEQAVNVTKVAEAALLSSQRGTPIYLDLR